MIDASTLASMIESVMERNPDRVANDEAILTFVTIMRGEHDEMTTSA